jgi:hypothetical protein
MGCSCIQDIVVSVTGFGILDFREKARKYMKEYC